MLAACKAIAIGRTDAQVEFLARTAQRCGFAFVEGLRDGELPPPRTLLRFILVHYLVGDDVLRSILHEIRRGPNDVRFSPVILIADDCPFESVLSYIRLGVDDVISLPEKREVLVQRLASQLNTEQMYVETPDYFGPDRRRMDMDVHDSRRRGLAGHGRYYIRRVPDRGIEIVRHEIFTAKNDEQGPPSDIVWAPAP
jgi:hypothetical protein